MYLSNVNHEYDEREVTGSLEKKKNFTNEYLVALEEKLEQIQLKSS